jgi:hypothetical protein
MPTVPTSEPEAEDQSSLMSKVAGAWLSPHKLINAAARAAFGDRFFPYERYQESKAKQEAISKMQAAQAPAGLLKLPRSQNIEDIRGPASKESMPKTVGESQAHMQEVEKGWQAFEAKPSEPEKFPAGMQPSMKGVATKEMGLNEQEQFLYQHHLDNYAKGGVQSAGGTKTSSLLAITVGSKDKSDPKTYVVPTILDNKVLSKDEAIQRADDLGLDKFPSYDSREQANARYSQMHDYMDRDMQ